MNKSLIYAILTVTLLIVISIVMVASSQSNQYLFHRDDFIQDKMYMNDVHILRLVWNQFLYFVRPLFVVIGCTYFAPTLKDGLSQYLPLWMLHAYRYVDGIVDVLILDIEYMLSGTKYGYSKTNSDTSDHVSVNPHIIPDLEPNPDDVRNHHYILDYNGECVNDDVYGVIPLETSNLWKQHEKIAEIEKQMRKKEVKIPPVRYS